MHAIELLLLQTRQQHEALARATDVAPEDALWSPDGARPSIAWLLDHLERETVTSAEAITGTAPRASVPESPPPWSELRARWLATSAATLRALERLAPEDLERPPAIELVPAFRASHATRARFWSGHVFHLAYHLGQIGSLRAARGLGWWSAE